MCLLFLGTISISNITCTFSNKETRDILAAQDLDVHMKDLAEDIKYLDLIEIECAKNRNREDIRYMEMLKEAKEKREKASEKLMIVNHRVRHN